MTKSKINITELINATVLLALAAWIWWYSADFPTLQENYPGPSLFPRIIATGFLLCGILLLVQALRKAVDLISPGRIKFKRIALLAAGLLLVSIAPALQEHLEFVVVLGIICFCFGLLLRVVWWKAILTAVVTALFIYLVFVNLLGVPL